MVDVKRALAADWKEDKLNCFYEMKMMEEKWKAKAAAEERKATKRLPDKLVHQVVMEFLMMWACRPSSKE
uniref:Uncharacterized protein n=1 Tax=Aegilops tauschii TaxID=37682 RepID=M8C6N5_AEGTA